METCAITFKVVIGFLITLLIFMIFFALIYTTLKEVSLLPGTTIVLTICVSLLCMMGLQSYGPLAAFLGKDFPAESKLDYCTEGNRDLSAEQTPGKRGNLRLIAVRLQSNLYAKQERCAIETITPWKVSLLCQAAVLNIEHDSIKTFVA